MSKTLTCVYCGMAYPEGTPPHGAKVLTDHIKICEKHPMREAEDTILKLRRALAGLVGVSTKQELEAMELALRSTHASNADTAVIINAIRILNETEIKQKPTVFRVDSGEWWAGYDLESVKAEYYKEACITFNEALDSPRELTDEEIDKTIHPGDKGKTKDPITFRQVLDRMIEIRFEFPRFFASSGL